MGSHLQDICLHRPLPTGFPYPCELNTTPLLSPETGTNAALRISKRLKVMSPTVKQVSHRANRSFSFPVKSSWSVHQAVKASFSVLAPFTPSQQRNACKTPSTFSSEFFRCMKQRNSFRFLVWSKSCPQIERNLFRHWILVWMRYDTGYPSLCVVSNTKWVSTTSVKVSKSTLLKSTLP